MKNISFKSVGFALSAALLMTFASSCSRMGKRKTVISANENGDVRRIEYAGTIVLNAQKNGVDYMSDDGYLKYEHNGQRIAARSDHKGKVHYAYNGDTITRLDEQAKSLLAEAVKSASEQQLKAKAEQGR